jgi:hypothetical protein
LRRLLAIALTVGLVAACTSAPPPTPGIPIDPSAIPGWPLVLTFDARGNPPVILRINKTDVAHLGCGQGTNTTFAPGKDGVPALPWDLEVIREADGQVLLREQVTTMPKFILAFPDTVGMGVFPAQGPAPPTCAPV